MVYGGATYKKYNGIEIGLQVREIISVFIV
jgi:hypothetical protein